MATIVSRVGLSSDVELTVSSIMDMAGSISWSSDVTFTLDGRESKVGTLSLIGEVVGITPASEGQSFDPDVIIFADDGSMAFIVGAETTHSEFNVLVHSWQFGGPENEVPPSEVTTGFIRVGLEEMYNIAYATHYTEMTYSGDNLTTVEIWQNISKALKLFTRDLTYIGDNLTGVVTTDEVEGSVLTTTLAYTGDNLDTVTKVVS